MCWRALIAPRPTCAPAARRAAARRNLTAPRARRPAPATATLAPLARPRVADPRPSRLPPTEPHPAYASESAPRAPHRRGGERPSAVQEIPRLLRQLTRPGLATS